MNPALFAALVLVLAGLALTLLWWWAKRQRWALARERALADRLREERDRALAHLATREAEGATERQARAALAETLASASHDLRQPAHAIGLYLAALDATPLPPEARELMPRLAASRQALESLLAGLADVSRLDAGAVAPQWDTVALAPLLQRLADEWALPAESSGLRLALHIAEPDLLTVTDPRLLERVLRNLLANAVRYTRAGGVLLACRLRTGSDGRRRVRIEVWDSGVGIAEADQERVFEAFEQGPAGRRNAAREGTAAGPAGAKGAHEQGQGLGLAIVRRLAALLELRVQLHSRPGRGSVFFVEGLVPAGHASRAAAATRERLRRLQGLAVAVLDDDAAVRDATTRLLQAWGCQVAAAGDAAGLRAAWPAPPELLLADLRLADGGWGPAQLQALHAAWGRLPRTLWISAEAPAAAAAHLPPGSACLAKPLAPSALRAALEQCMDPPEPEQAPR
jgi:two-component system, sensor histidine kinase